MKVTPTSIEGVAVVDTDLIHDHRGAFARLFCERDLAEVFSPRRVVQTNLSRTVARGALRGMHFQQAPHAEAKLVRCLRGRVFDVALDLRRGSPTFLKWHAEELSPDNCSALLIPEGCAHGFQALTDDCELLYLHTAFYEPSAEDGVRFDDPRAGIDWPLELTDISERDRNHALLEAGFEGFEI